MGSRIIILTCVAQSFAPRPGNLVYRACNLQVRIETPTQGMDSMSLKGALDDHAKLNTRDLGDGSVGDSGFPFADWWYIDSCSKESKAH